MIKTLEPGYTIPKRETIMHALDANYVETKAKVLELVQNSAAVSFTTDMWSSLRMEAYMTVTAHFITEDWRLECLVLETKHMEETHTAANIAKRLSEVADATGIPGLKRVAVVHDNAASMVLCAEILEKDDEWAKFKGVRCSGHTLQLCINAALKQDPICRTVAAARRLVAHFKKSTKATQGLKEKQKQQDIEGHLLIQDVSTRWNSTYSMLERLVEQRWPVTAVLSDPNFTKKNDRTLDLTTAQWNMAEDIGNVLKPMITLTELLSEEDNVSLSATLPMLANMNKRHLTVHDEDSPTTIAMKTKLKNEIDERWELKGRLIESSVYVQAAVIDPRFKQLAFLDDEKRDEAYILVAELADHLSADESGPAVEPQRDSYGEEEEPAPPKKRSDKERQIAMLLRGDDEEDTDEDQERGGKEEIKDYLQDRTKVETGPLAWWRKNEERYPKLARVAKHLLSIPATSTPSERIFSKAGFIVSKTRSSLLPKNVDKLIFLAHNLKRF